MTRRLFAAALIAVAFTATRWSSTGNDLLFTVLIGLVLGLVLPVTTQWALRRLGATLGRPADVSAWLRVIRDDGVGDWRAGSLGREETGEWRWRRTGPQVGPPEILLPGWSQRSEVDEGVHVKGVRLPMCGFIIDDHGIKYEVAVLLKDLPVVTSLSPPR